MAKRTTYQPGGAEPSPEAAGDAPFDPTGTFDPDRAEGTVTRADAPWAVPAVVIEESDPHKLRDMWMLANDSVIDARAELQRQMNYMAAVEARLRAVQPSNINELGRQVRRVLDDRDWFRNQDKDLGGLLDQLERIVIAKAKENGVEKMPTHFVSISVKDELQVAYDKDRWESIIVGLIGVEFDAGRFDKLGSAMQSGDPASIDAAIRGFLNIGRLDCVQRRLSSKPILDMAASGVPLPEALRIETVQNVVSFSRARGTNTADRLI